MASHIIVYIIVFAVVCIAICVIIWFCRAFICSKKNVTTVIQRPATALPSSLHAANSDHSAPLLPYIAPYPPKPPPLGFGEPDVNDTARLNDHSDMYPPTRETPYPVDHENSRAPYPSSASCYPPSHTAPYPVSDSIPQPSRPPYPLEHNLNGTLNSPYSIDRENNGAPYRSPTNHSPRSSHIVPYPVSDAVAQPSPSRPPYPSEGNLNETRNLPYPIDRESNRVPYSSSTSCFPVSQTAPYPVSDVAPQPSSPGLSYTDISKKRNSPRTIFYTFTGPAPYPALSSKTMPQPVSRITPGIEFDILPAVESTNTAPYPPAHVAPYPLANATGMPQPSSSRNSYSSEPSAPETPLSSRPYSSSTRATCSTEQPPPSYEEVMHKTS